MLERGGGDEWGSDNHVKLSGSGYPLSVMVQCCVYLASQIHCYATH